MKKSIILLVTLVSLSFASDTITKKEHQNHQHQMSAKHKKMKKNPPFLIIGKMPHLTRLVKSNWDKLDLTKEQQEKLIKLRKETISNIKSLTPKIRKLEKEVAKSALLGDEPKSLKDKVNEIAALKAKATMVHIKCIYETKKILTPKQLEKILPKKTNKKGK